MKFLPGTSTDEKIMLQTAIDELLQDTKSLTELTAVTRGKPIQIEGVYSTNIHKRLASLKNYPDPSLNGDAFWKALTRHAKANGITTDNERCIHFALAIQSDSNLVTWYETTVQGRNLKIADIEDQFYQHTLSPYWLSQRLATLVGILYRPRELVRTFNVRFHEAVQGYRVDTNSQLPGHAWLRELYLQKLPNDVRSKGPTIEDAVKKFKSLFELTSHFARIFPDEPAPFLMVNPKCQRSKCCQVLTCPTCESKTKRPYPLQSSETRKPKREKTSPKQLQWCKYHQAEVYHREEDCRKAPSPKNRRIATEPAIHQDMLKSILGEEEDPVSQPILRKVEVTEDSIMIPLRLHGVKMKALADTGATANFITPALVKQLQLPVTPSTIDAPPILVASKQTIPRIGTCQKVLIEMSPRLPGQPNRLLRSDFEIMELSGPNLQVILGCPTLANFGIALEALPHTFPEDKQAPPEDDLPDIAKMELKTPSPTDQRPSLEEIEAFFETENKEHQLYNVYITYLSLHLQEQIQPLLSINSQLQGFCTLPNSEIAFDTGSAYPSYRRPFRIPHAQESIVSEQVKKWLDAGIIVRNTRISPWNSALLVAPKKDSSGNIKGWRVCIDPRHINQLLPDANYPLPLIREILEDLSDAIIYSKIDLKQGFNQLRVRPMDQIKTSFTWQRIQYMFVGAPFGFKNIPSTFQLTISSVFAGLPYVRVYVDDIVIFSTSATVHISNVKEVLHRLTSRN